MLEKAENKLINQKTTIASFPKRKISELAFFKLEYGGSMDEDILSKRINKFMKYLKRKKSDADSKISKSSSSWNRAYSNTMDAIIERADVIFSGKLDKSFKG